MKRNIILDYFKIFLSVLVVFRHFSIELIFKPEYFKQLSTIEFFTVWEITALAKIPVPIFCIIGGYFIDLTDKKRTIKYFKRILILYIVWMAFYLPWYIGDNVFNFIFSIFKGFYHLWYLTAVLQGIIIYYILRKLIKNDIVLLSLSIILFLIGYIIQINLHNYLGFFEQTYFRNGLMVGFPFLAIGQFIRKYNFLKYKKYMPYLAIIGIIMVLVEGFIYLEGKFYYDIYASSILVCPVLLVFILQYGKLKEITNPNILLMSSGIYFIHPYLLMQKSTYIPQTGHFLYQFPCLLILVFLMSILVIQTNKTIKIFL